MYRVDVYLRVRRAVMVEGKSIREVSREFGLHRDTVRKMLAYSVPPGYRRQSPPKRSKLEPFTGVIDRILEDDLRLLRKQRHTAKRIFERLRDEYGSLDAARQWVEKEQLPFAVLNDPDRRVGIELGMSALDGERYVKDPSDGKRPTVVIDEHGVICEWEPDMNDTDQIAKLLERL